MESFRSYLGAIVVVVQDCLISAFILLALSCDGGVDGFRLSFKSFNCLFSFWMRVLLSLLLRIERFIISSLNFFFALSQFSNVGFIRISFSMFSEGN